MSLSNSMSKSNTLPGSNSPKSNRMESDRPRSNRVRDAFNPAARGYHFVYRENCVNHCPGCGHTHWYIGRAMAECGFCATALPLSESFSLGSMVSVRTIGHDWRVAAGSA